MSTLEFNCRLELENSFFNDIHVYIDKDTDPYYIALKSLFDLGLQDYINNNYTTNDEIEKAWYSYYTLFTKHLGHICDTELCKNNFQSDKFNCTYNINFFEDMCGDYEIYWQCCSDDVSKYWDTFLMNGYGDYLRAHPEMDISDDNKEED